MNSADLLTAVEACDRKGFWARSWEKHRLQLNSMMSRAVTHGLTIQVSDDFGQLAGDEFVTLAAERGIDLDGINLHTCAVNHAAIADLIVTAIRKPGDRPWAVPRTQNWDGYWKSSASVDPTGAYLRRFLPVTNWNDERQNFEVQSWYGLGEVCHLRMPMQMVVAILGPLKNGRRHNPWSKGLLHPKASHLRFQKKQAKLEGFKETWISVFREERDEINRERWLDAMFEDDVLRDILFVVDIPYPEEGLAEQIREMAKRQIDQVTGLNTLPAKKLSVCRGPLTPCPFRSCCWAESESVPDAQSFDAVL